MSLASLALKSSFENFLESLPPGVAEDNSFLLEQIAVKRFSPFYLVHVNVGLTRYTVGWIVFKKQDVISKLIEHFECLIEEIRIIENPEEAEREYKIMLKDLGELTGDKLDRNETFPNIKELSDNFVLKEMEIKTWFGVLVLTQQASVLAHIIDGSFTTMVPPEQNRN